MRGVFPHSPGGRKREHIDSPATPPQINNATSEILVSTPSDGAPSSANHYNIRNTESKPRRYEAGQVLHLTVYQVFNFGGESLQIGIKGPNTDYVKKGYDFLTPLGEPSTPGPKTFGVKLEYSDSVPKSLMGAEFLENNLCPGSTKYVNIGGTGMCQTCPTGHSSVAGATSCTCFAGSYVPNAGNCELCPVGKYSSTSGQSHCTACPAGKTTTGPGMTNFNDCASTDAIVSDHDAGGLKTVARWVGEREGRKREREREERGERDSTKHTKQNKTKQKAAPQPRHGGMRRQPLQSLQWTTRASR